MGTRHFIGVVVDGEFKIAQYGQWDGYLDGQGKDVLKFIKGFYLTGSENFRNQLRKCRWITQDEIDKYKNGGSFPKVLSRDAGAQVLEIVATSKDEEIVVMDSRSFPADSLFCEYAYVLDMDTEVLEVYKGFNDGPLDENERFHPDNWPHADPDINKEYGPVRLAFKMTFTEADEGFQREHYMAVGYTFDEANEAISDTEEQDD